MRNPASSSSKRIAMRFLAVLGMNLIFSVAIYAAEDSSARRALLELRSRINELNMNKCAEKKQALEVDPEKFMGRANLDFGDADARVAIVNLRRQTLNLEKTCGVELRPFLSIGNEQSSVFSIGSDDELRRAILELRTRIKTVEQNIIAKIDSVQPLIPSEWRTASGCQKEFCEELVAYVWIIGEGRSLLSMIQINPEDFRPTRQSMGDIKKIKNELKESDRLVVIGSGFRTPGKEFNLAIGQKVADNVRHEFQMLGVPFALMESISHGNSWTLGIDTRLANKSFPEDANLIVDLSLLNQERLKKLPIKDRINAFVSAELKKWLTLSDAGLEEIPPPNYPPAISIKQEPWEKNEEFESRVEKARNERRLAIDKIQAEYKAKVENRNLRVNEFNKLRTVREAGVASRRQELIAIALNVIKPSITMSDVTLDQQTGTLTMSAQVEGLDKRAFAFANASQELRKAAFTSLGTLNVSPNFEVSATGEISLKAVVVDGSGYSVRGLPSDSNPQNSFQLSIVTLPSVPVQAISQQSSVTVDRNQVEQILYRDENQLLRQRLEEQRSQQQQAIAQAQARLQGEITRLKAEADALRQQPAQPRSSTVSNIKSAHALVIGNAAYSGSAKLDNPVNDAKAIADKLRAMGFEVKEVINAGRESMVKELSEFNRAAAKADLTLMYYAGHGVQISGTNYMIPTDMKLNEVAQAPLQAVSLDMVVERYLPGKTKLVFLDACRDNPLLASTGRGVSKGLAPINVSEGTLIAYATKDGQTADDGADDKNSPFTRALLEHLNDPEDISLVLRTVRAKVMQRTNNRQQPWDYGSLTGGALVLSAIRSK
jgi:hypothetical protein